MKSKIGTIYSLHVNNREDIYAIIKMNKKENTYTLECISESPNYGKSVTLDAKRFDDMMEPIGPVFEVNGEICEEDGIIYIKQDQKVKVKNK